MTAAAGRFAGLDRYEARKQVLAELEKLGLPEKTEAYKLSIGKCHRCKTVVEPLVSKQWWMKMKPLAEPAIKAVGGWADSVRARQLGQNIFRVDVQHPRLVHLAATVVGAPHPRVALRSVR